MKAMIVIVMLIVNLNKLDKMKKKKEKMRMKMKMKKMKMKMKKMKMKMKKNFLMNNLYQNKSHNKLFKNKISIFLIIKIYMRLLKFFLKN